MLHESGHAVYDKYIDAKLPYVLREVSHISWTEAIAQMFGRFSKNAYWMQQMLSLSDEERNKIEQDSYKMLQAQELVFSRWTQVMFRFEREMYRNPDQNLNALWWDLVKQYQLINPPEGRNKPDYAAKIHFSSSPAYYHNYQIGELIASQVHNYIAKNVLKQSDVVSVTYIGHKETGDYLIKKIFSKGSTLRWDALIKEATGEELNPKYFAEQFVK
jgi:peptidyl-dipeptidase A